MNIRLTSLAKEDYQRVLEYLLDKWTVTEHDNFIDAVDDLMQVLVLNPKAFRLSSYREVRVVPVVPQVSVFYYIEESANTIWIMRFWSNRKDPSTFTVG